MADTITLDTELLARVDADAAKHGQTRHDTLHYLLNLGLQAAAGELSIDAANWAHVMDLIRQYGDARAEQARHTPTDSAYYEAGRRADRLLLQEIRVALGHYAAPGVADAPTS